MSQELRIKKDEYGQIIKDQQLRRANIQAAAVRWIWPPERRTPSIEVTFGNLSGFCLTTALVVAAGLVPVAAVLHLTPAPAVVPADIQKQPATIFIGT